MSDELQVSSCRLRGASLLIGSIRIGMRPHSTIVDRKTVMSKKGK